MIFALCAAVCLSAQGIPEGSHWFDGSAWYTATELEGGILFSGDSADGTYTFGFRLARTKAAGTYKLEKATDESIVPFRTEYGTKVKAVGKGGTTLAFLDEDGLTSWTLVWTDKSQRDCLATEFWAKSQPLEKMASSYVMNTHYLSVLSKTQLRYMKELLEGLLEKGLRLYVLSNCGYRFREFEYKIPCRDQFSGMLVSAEESLLKPDAKVFQRLCEKFQLQMDECVFVDDLQKNVDGAIAAGMQGYCFADGNVEKLKAYLSGVNG